MNLTNNFNYMSNKLYDVLKWVALTACYAFAIFYKQVGEAWGWPHIDQVVTTINAVGLLIGTLIGVEGAVYNSNKNK